MAETPNVTTKKLCVMGTFITTSAIVIAVEILNNIG